MGKIIPFAFVSFVVLVSLCFGYGDVLKTEAKPSLIRNFQKFKSLYLSSRSVPRSTYRLLFSNSALPENKLNNNSESKLSIGIKTGLGYNYLLKRVIRDSTQQLIIGLSAKQKITEFMDIEFAPAYQYIKSVDFGEGFTGVYYLNNLLLPIGIDFKFLKKGFITLIWNGGVEPLVEFDGNWELWLEDSLFSKGKIEHCEKFFYIYTGLGGEIYISPRVHIQLGFCLGYSLTRAVTHVISNYPLRLYLGVMYFPGGKQ
ncbi:MAG: hypothetical protein ABIL39_05515 [candidate division WOR-3 bacterium]